MFLHEQRVITLQHGLAIFRSAMTIRSGRRARGKIQNGRLPTLEHHYKERVLQVHVMMSMRAGLERIQGPGIVLAYFTLTKEDSCAYFRTSRIC